MDMLPPGQAGIQFRRAWMAGDLPGMVAMLPLLDPPHRVELILGAALRDARGDFAAARALAAGADAEAVLPMLLGVPDTSLDEAVSAWITARVVPAIWRPEGDPIGALDLTARGEAGREVVARAYGAGVGGQALLDALSDRPLHAAVARYYATSTLWVLGPRPLLILGG